MKPPVVPLALAAGLLALSVPAAASAATSATIDLDDVDRRSTGLSYTPSITAPEGSTLLLPPPPILTWEDAFASLAPGEQALTVEPEAAGTARIPLTGVSVGEYDLLIGAGAAFSGDIENDSLAVEASLNATAGAASEVPVDLGEPAERAERAFVDAGLTLVPGATVTLTSAERDLTAADITVVAGPAGSDDPADSSSYTDDEVQLAVSQDGGTATFVVPDRFPVGEGGASPGTPVTDTTTLEILVTTGPVVEDGTEVESQVFVRGLTVRVAPAATTSPAPGGTAAPTAMPAVPTAVPAGGAPGEPWAGAAPGRTPVALAVAALALLATVAAATAAARHRTR